jgi:hypothetical protein
MVSRVKGIPSIWNALKRISNQSKLRRSFLLSSMAAISKLRSEEEFEERELDLAKIGRTRWQSANPEKTLEDAPSNKDFMILEYGRLIDEEAAREMMIETGTSAERRQNASDLQMLRGDGEGFSSGTTMQRAIVEEVQRRRSLQTKPQEVKDDFQSKVHGMQEERRRANILWQSTNAPNERPEIFYKGLFHETWSREQREKYLALDEKIRNGGEIGMLEENMAKSIQRRSEQDYWWYLDMLWRHRGSNLHELRKRHRILRLLKDGPGRGKQLQQCEEELIKAHDRFESAKRSFKATRDVPTGGARTSRGMSAQATSDSEGFESDVSKEVIDLREDTADIVEGPQEKVSGGGKCGGGFAAALASSRARSSTYDEDLPDLQNSSDDEHHDDGTSWYEDNARTAASSRKLAQQHLGEGEDADYYGVPYPPYKRGAAAECFSEADYEYRRRALDREQVLRDDLRERRDARSRSSAGASAYGGLASRERSVDSSTRASVTSLLDEDSDDGSMVAKLKRKRPILVTAEQSMDQIPSFNLTHLQSLYRDFSKPRSTRPTARHVWAAFSPIAMEEMRTMIKWAAADAAVRAQLGDPASMKDWDVDRIFKMSSLLLAGRIGPHQVQTSRMQVDAGIPVAYRNFYYEATAAGNIEFQSRSDNLLRGQGLPTIAEFDQGILRERGVLSGIEQTNLKKQFAAVTKVLLKTAEDRDCYSPLMTAVEKTGVNSTTAEVDLTRFIYLRDWLIYLMEEMAIVSHALLSGMRLGLRLMQGTKADWERSRSGAAISPFAYQHAGGGKRQLTQTTITYEKRPRGSDFRSTDASGGGAPVRYSDDTQQPNTCQVCNRKHGGNCLLDSHPDANRALGKAWKDHSMGQRGLTLLPPMLALHPTYSMTGAILPEGTRQALADVRSRAQGRETKKVRPQAEINAWGTGGASAVRPATAPPERA